MKHLQIKVLEIPVYQTFQVWKEAQWMHVLKGNESLRMTKQKTWLQEVSWSRGYGIQTYIKKCISEFMKSRLLQSNMEQPLLPAKEPCLLIYLNVKSCVALWWNLIGRHASAILDLMSRPLHSVNIWCSMNYVVTSARNSLLMGTLFSLIFLK